MLDLDTDFDDSYKCWVHYNSLFYKIWMGVQGIALCLKIALVPYIMATNDNNLIDESHNYCLKVIFIFQIMDLVFNLTTERMVDIKLVNRLVSSAKIYMKTWMIPDILCIIATNMILS